MNIAVCISGQPRLDSSAIESLQDNLLSVENCDVFLSISPTIRDAFNIRKETYVDLNEIHRHLPYKSLTIIPDWEIIEFLAENPGENEVDMTNVLSYWYTSAFRKIYSSLKLKNEYSKLMNKSYDFVVRARIDIVYRERINFKSLSTEHIMIPKGFTLDNGGVPDHISIATNKITNQAYENIRYTDVERGTKYIGPEMKLNHSIDKAGVRIIRNEWSYSLACPNGDHNDGKGKYIRTIE